MRPRTKIATYAILASGLFLLGKFWHRKLPVNPVLPPGASNEVLMNPQHHTITVVTPNGSTSHYVGDHPTAVVVSPNGTVTVKTQTFGFEDQPFLGLSYGDRLRVATGLGFLYFHRWDLNVGLAISPSGGTAVRAFTALSYNLYSNTFLFVGVDNKTEPLGGFVLRF